MVQDQLVEYITSQTKAGIRAETIKATLVAAGWQSVDVDDTLKKIQGPAAGAAASVQPVAAVGPKPIATAKAEPQTIRVSDLVSASTSTTSVSASGAKQVDTKMESTKKFLTPTSSPGATSYQSTTTRTTSSSSSSRGPITVEIILGILMVAFGAVAAYFFFANRSLTAQVATLSAQSAGVSTQVSALQNQLDASTTALIAQAASATAQNQELALDLSFYAVPPGVTATSTSTMVLNGTVSGGGSKLYVITTINGAKVYVSNSKDPKVIALMQPLVGTNMSVPFGGTYMPGINNITLTVINGASLIAPPATTTASSTATSTGTAAMSSSTAASTTGQ